MTRCVTERVLTRRHGGVRRIIVAVFQYLSGENPIIDIDGILSPATMEGKPEAGEFSQFIVAFLTVDFHLL